MVLDENCVQRFVKGNLSAFESIFHSSYPTLVSFAVRHSVDVMVAEDIVMEILNVAWEHRERFENAAALKSFLFTAVHNKAINQYRNIKNRERILKEKLPIEDVDVFEDLLIEEEAYRLLHATIEKLPLSCRNVIKRYMQGLSLKEIAEDLKISVNTVKTQKLRGIKKLREKFKNNLQILILLQILENLS